MAAPTAASRADSFFFFAPLFIPLVILGVPIVDTLFAIIRRARNRSGIVRRPTRTTCTTGSCASGHGHRRSVFILWAWTALLSGFVLYPIYSGSGDGVVPFGIAAILLLLYMFLHPGLRTKRDVAEMGDDEGETPPEPPVVGPVSHRPPGPPPAGGEG